jgi:hypothetical protein
MSIREVIQQIVRDEFAEVYGVPCRVKTVDMSAKTCVCAPVNGDADFIDVRLQADPGNGILVEPKVNSVVMVQPINPHTGYISMFSAVESIKFLDGSFGGLTKTQELKTQLDKTNEVVQAIVDSLKNWVVVPSDGGAALKTFFNTTLGAKQKGDFTNIENTKITHGNV